MIRSFTSQLLRVVALGIVLSCARALAQDQLQKPAPGPSGGKSVPYRPLYYQLAERPENNQQEDAKLQRALAETQKNLEALQQQLQSGQAQPQATHPVPDSAGKPMATPEEEAAARKLQEQSAKMKELLEEHRAYLEQEL